MATVGFFAVLIAIGSAVALAIFGFQAMRSGRSSGPYLKWSVYGLFGGAVVAMTALEVAIMRDDFSIAYVANNSTVSTPTLFKLAAGWAALEGSIVLWGLVLAIFVYTVYLQVAKREKSGTEEGGIDRLGAGALGVLGMISVFFFGLMVTVSNPFEVCIEPAMVGCIESSGLPWTEAVPALAGRGPNPLLQNHFLMAVHPPMLYFGYVGMAVPYAFAMAALMLGSTGSAWLTRTRSWTLIAWGFLTLGIVLGGIWSYEVLGWGGYWAWDPVENASFIPWLVATAFLHSAVVQQRRGMLQAWNFVLVIATFALTILGTFLTRSGVIVSVHSFTQSPIGPVLLAFLVVVLFASFTLFAARIQVVASSPRLDSLASREGVFLANNLLLTIFALVVLVGTLYPMFLEFFADSEVGVGRPFFDRMAIPLCFALLLTMGIGPVTPWRVARASVVWERIAMPLRLALGAAALAVIFSQRNGYLLLGIVTSSFVAFVIVRNLYHSAKRAADRNQMSLPAAALRVMRNDTGYWGGQISHLGVAIMAFGIAFSANLVVESTLDLAPGDTGNVAGYDITYVTPFTREDPHRSVTGASIQISRGDRVLGFEEPRLNRYGADTQPVATPAVDESWNGDLYLALQRIDSSGVTLGVWWFPFIWMVWVGGLLTGLAVLWSRLVRKPAREREPAARAGGHGS